MIKNPFSLSEDQLQTLLKYYISWSSADPEGNYIQSLKDVSDHINKTFFNAAYLDSISNKDLKMEIKDYIRKLEGPVQINLGNKRIGDNLKGLKSDFRYLLKTKDDPFDVMYNLIDGKRKKAFFAKAFWSPILQSRYPEDIPNWNNKTERLFKKLGINLKTTKLSTKEKIKKISDGFKFLQQLEPDLDFYKINHLMHYGTVIEEGKELIEQLNKNQNPEFLIGQSDNNLGKNIFVFTASNKAAQAHLRETVEASISEAKLEKYLSSDDYDDLKTLTIGKGFYAWGATPGPNNKRNWEKLKKGDEIIVYYNKAYHYHSIITQKVHNIKLAEKLWGTLPNGDTWEYMYFFEKPSKFEKPLPSVDTGEYLQASYQGFTKIKDSKAEIVHNEFGTAYNLLVGQAKKEKRKYWAGGFHWNDDNQLRRFIDDGIWEIGWSKKDKESMQFYTHESQINVGDFIALKSYGGSHILKISAIGEITSTADIQNGILEVSWTQTEGLYHGPAPKGVGAGNWFGTFLEVKRSEDINMIFNIQSVKPILKTNKKVSKIIHHIFDYCKGQGFNYDIKEIANFYLSLKTKPFVILAGISGTGKTKLVELFAEAIGYGDNEHCVIIPVKPDWTDNSDLLGYTNLNKEFEKKKLTEVILSAKDNPNEPFFVVLDEMNLARVEHYFSDFLSIIETRKIEGDKFSTKPMLSGNDVGQETKYRDKLVNLQIPQNLFIVGTVNMDETTFPFSKKVLDRANSIEMNQVKLDFIDKPVNVEPLQEIYSDFLISDKISSKHLKADDTSLLKENGFIEELKDINKVQTNADLQFAYRVRDEIAFYLLNSIEVEDILSWEDAFDYQVMQKILPRIQGSALSINHLLINLINHFMEEEKFETKMHYEEDIKKELQEYLATNPKYSRTLSKLDFMLRKYSQDGFTSFWI